MANRTPDQLTSATSAGDDDLLLIYPSGGPLKKLTFSVFLGQVLTGLGGAVLTVANNLSDLASASAARANLGLGTAATLAQSAVFQVANNFSEVANAATARTNIGAAASNAPTITGGMTFSGASKGNPQALAGTEIDASLSEFFTKSISANTTFTFTGATASKVQAFILKLTKSAGAAETWPASVDWAYATAPPLEDGTHLLGFLSDDGGTTWFGLLLGAEFG